jgi:NitT/TauT family transport system substrate-binding protein
MRCANSGVKAVIKGQGEPLAANECNLQILPPPEMPAALASRKIDAYIVAEPFNAMGEIKAGARMLRFTGDIWKNHPCCVICMHEQATTEKQEWTQKVMNAVVKAQIYASQNKAEVARMMSKDGEGYLPMPAPTSSSAP